MSDLLEKAIHQLVGTGDHCLASPGNALQPGDPLASVMVTLNPSKSVRDDLAGRGYTTIRWFLVLPSLTSPRWLFPFGNGRCAIEGLQIYTPYARIARIGKGLLTAMVAARCQGLAPHRLLVASRGPLPLEALVREVTGECHPVFALLLGASVRFRKLTLQVMRLSGEILGYIKLPLTDAAVERVRHEADTLNRLWGFAALRPHISQVLYSGEWEDGYILFQSGGPSRPGPVQFNRQCKEFLKLLWGIHTVEKPGHVLCEEVSACWRKAQPTLSSGWRALGQAALAKARRELDGVMVPCGIAHGDFAPWNTRVKDHGLYVFDWESASWDAPISWDAFHFHVQVASLLNEKGGQGLHQNAPAGERISFLLYLLSSMCQLLEEGVPPNNISFEYRRRMLMEDSSRG